MSESREADAQRFQSESVTCALRWVLSCERTATGVRSGEDRTKSRRREKERHTDNTRSATATGAAATSDRPGRPLVRASPRKTVLEEDRAGAGGRGRSRACGTVEMLNVNL